MKRVLPLLALGAAALAVGASPATARYATNECRGLKVCVPIEGPWVVVRPGRNALPPRVEYQLTCPRGFVVAGLDAELSDRAIDIAFLARTGSPVNPGISTSRAVVFVATYAGFSRSAVTFKPHAGCAPSAGGGGRLPASVSIFGPSRPTIRRVATVPVRHGGQRVVKSCRPGERLIAASHAIGFLTPKPPSRSVVASVTDAQAVRGDGVVVSVRAGVGLGRAPAVVQAGVVCAEGR